MGNPSRSRRNGQHRVHAGAHVDACSRHHGAYSTAALDADANACAHGIRGKSLWPYPSPTERFHRAWNEVSAAALPIRNAQHRARNTQASVGGIGFASVQIMRGVIAPPQFYRVKRQFEAISSTALSRAN